MRRDGLTEVEARRRMQAQQTDAFYTDRSDFVLDNTTAVSADEADAMLAALNGALLGETN